MTKVKFRGKEYSYRVDFYAIKEYQAETGKSFEDTIQAGLLSKDGLEALELIYYYAIKGQCIFEGVDFDLKKEDMVFLLNTIGTAKAIEDVLVFYHGIGQAIVQAKPKEDKAAG